MADQRFCHFDSPKIHTIVLPLQESRRKIASQRSHTIGFSAMPIKVQCNSCGAGFAAKDELAGKRVACPKCKQPIVIPAPAGGAMDDLLDEIGLGAGAATGGKQCPSCRATMATNAIICVNCSYNVQTGKRVVESGANPLTAGSKAETVEELLSKAEQQLKEAPLQHSDHASGEGGMSYLIASGALLIAASVIAITIVIVQAISTTSDGKKDFAGNKESDESGAISLMAGGGVMAFAGAVWLVLLAFQGGVGQGLAVLFIPLYALVYALSKSRSKIASSMYIIGSILLTIGIIVYDFK